jgi:hypothetical protein
MVFFTMQEFTTKYSEYAETTIPTWLIEAASEMIFSQIGLIRGDTSWNETSVPLPIKNASMEQLRFMLEHDIPFIDSKEIKAGNMEAKLSSDYSTLALRILANYGYLYRGNPINYNMNLDLPFGD